MTHDFAKRHAPRTPSPGAKKSRPTPQRKSPKAAPAKGRLMVFASLLLLLAAFGGGLYLLRSVPPTAVTPVPDTKANADKPTQNMPEAAPAEKDDPRFKFYDLLQESEVSTSQIDAYQPKDKDKPSGKTYHYILQTGSFRSQDEAEKHKANIAFQGIKANIETVQNAQGQTWYRVATDTYKDEARMNSALDKLAALNVKPMIRKIEVPTKSATPAPTTPVDAKKP